MPRSKMTANVQIAGADLSARDVDHERRSRASFAPESVTDERVKVLMKLPDSENLHLNLQISGITEEGARELQEVLSHARIIWGVPPMDLR